MPSAKPSIWYDADCQDGESDKTFKVMMDLTEVTTVSENHNGVGVKLKSGEFYVVKNVTREVMKKKVKALRP